MNKLTQAITIGPITLEVGDDMDTLQGFIRLSEHYVSSLEKERDKLKASNRHLRQNINKALCKLEEVREQLRDKPPPLIGNSPALTKKAG